MELEDEALMDGLLPPFVTSQGSGGTMRQRIADQLSLVLDGEDSDPPSSPTGCTLELGAGKASSSWEPSLRSSGKVSPAADEPAGATTATARKSIAKQLSMTMLVDDERSSKAGARDVLAVSGASSRYSGFSGSGCSSVRSCSGPSPDSTPRPDPPACCSPLLPPYAAPS